jgi:hypothetical protein
MSTEPTITAVEFRPHIAGYRLLEDGTQQDVEFDQWILLVNDGPDGQMVQAGYVQKADGGGIPLIRRFSPENLGRIQALVEAEKGARKPVNQPTFSQDDDEDDEDDDEE